MLGTAVDKAKAGLLATLELRHALTRSSLAKCLYQNKPLIKALNPKCKALRASRHPVGRQPYSQLLTLLTFNYVTKTLRQASTTVLN